MASSLKSEFKSRTVCKKSWPICYSALEAYKLAPEPQTLCLTSQFILSNFKINHFSSQMPGVTRAETLESFSQRVSNQKLEEEDLLIERQRHICECVDKEFERVKSEIRVRISKQLSNTEVRAGKGQNLVKKDWKDINYTYNEFIRKWKDKNPESQDDKSEPSQSGHSKPSHDLTNFNNTRKTILTSLPERVQRGSYRYPRPATSRQPLREPAKRNRS